MAGGELHDQLLPELLLRHDIEGHVDAGQITEFDSIALQVLDISGALPADLQMLARALPPVEPIGRRGANRVEGCVRHRRQRRASAQQGAAMQRGQSERPFRGAERRGFRMTDLPVPDRQSRLKTGELSPYRFDFDRLLQFTVVTNT